MSHCARILLLMTHVFISTIGDTSVVYLVNSKRSIRFIMYLLGHRLRVVREDGRIRSSPSSTATWRETWPVSATTSTGPFRLDQYEPEVAARGPGMKEDIALRFRAAKYLPSRERVAKEDLDPAVKSALGLTRTRRARRTGEAKDGGLRSWARRGRGCGRGSGSGRFIQRRCNVGRIIWLFSVGDFERLRRGSFSRRRRESRVEGSLDGWATTCCASRRERGRQSLRRREGANEEPCIPYHDCVNLAP